MVHQVTNSRANFNYNAFIYKDIEWTAHFHENFELIYCMEGTQTVHIDQEEYELMPGEMILIPPNRVHFFKTDSISRVWVGVFSADHIALFAKQYSSRSFSSFRCDEHIERYLKEVLFFEGTPERYILKSALYAVCSECKKKAAILDEKVSADVYNKILDYISKNYNTSITLKTMAKDLGYEYHYFSSVFHNCFSMNFKEFINIYRYQKACDLIVHDKYSITEIAMKSGFQSIRSFNDVFKALSGVTPSEYRKPNGTASLSAEEKYTDNKKGFNG